VLVATDALGMGLNLAINRVIFTAMSKWDGAQLISLKSIELTRTVQ
jgi:superfamily II RNA helicase